MTFKEFLKTAFTNGQYSTDDIIAFVKPLFEEVLSFHENNLVAPFFKEDALFITNENLDIDEKFAISSKCNISKINAINKKVSRKNFEIVATLKLETDVDAGTSKIEDANIIFKPENNIENPVYIGGYNSYEILLNHHDAQTDIFCLGLILGSMALGLNLYEEKDLKTFISYRKNPIQHNQRIHPTISALIAEMTELDRNARTQDLYDVIARLVNYRSYTNTVTEELQNTDGWIQQKNNSKNDFILNKLKNRLFDMSRRNRLLYYKPNARFVNLTVSSVPIVLNYSSIRPELLFTWNDEIKKKIIKCDEILLNKYLRFEDHKYLPFSLDKIRLESNKDINEYGFSQLKMVIAFLNWHNLKEDIHERIQSPLLLLSVELKKTKRVKEDHFSIKIIDSLAEVNPVLANYLKDLYGIQLPAFIDLNEVDLKTFYENLKQQIDASNQGIQLAYNDKPKIKLIHSIAKQTMSNYQRKLKNKTNLFNTYKDLDYSYEIDNYKPLGLEIFKNKIEHHASHLEFLINEDIQISSNQLTDCVTKERTLFEMAQSDNNAYHWDFDLCNIVLGNFNYKKMSLVRDYDFVVENNIPHVVFDELFSNKPKQIKNPKFDLNNITDWYPIITADPTQTKSILYNRTGESYIIQGPPGTGKSQTITNLIADYVAHEKSVLFVCEKRAALDVVFHRLKQNNLDELCCYIHDSQNDKRTFIQDLKKCYEDFLKNKKDVSTIEKNRTTVVENISIQIEYLKNYHSINSSKNENANCNTIQLIEKIIELKPYLLELTDNELETLPSYALWQEFGETIIALNKALEDEGCEDSFASHPFSQLNMQTILQPNALNVLQQTIADAKKLLTNIEDILKTTDLANFKESSLDNLKNLVDDCNELEHIVNIDKLDLINPQSANSKQLQNDLKQLEKINTSLLNQQKENENWNTKLSKHDLATSIEIAEKREESFLKFLYPDWSKMKATINNCYNFSAHQIKPKYKFVLGQLQHEYNILDEEANAKMTIANEYKSEDLNALLANINALHKKNESQQLDYLLHKNDIKLIVEKVTQYKSVFTEANIIFKNLLANTTNKNITILQDDLENIAINLSSLSNLLPALKEFASLPESFQIPFQTIIFNNMQAEASIANQSFVQLMKKQNQYANDDAITLEATVNKIKKYYKELLKINAQYINAKCRNKFLKNIDLSIASVTNLNGEQRIFKKSYAEGRKIVENEFSKSMRFKSIRELSTKESNLVIKDLKPIWLMSPLSISDSIPLDTTYFDVVIFDEASQITVEEGIPALYRAPQTIIVGDEKQMPPTNFFNSKAEDPDDIINEYEDDGSELLSSDADSLLVQGAKKLYSTMLSWHYRSSYETLISYSNHAFYNAELLTIPDIAIHNVARPEIIIDNKNDAEKNSAFLLDRSISYHYLPNALYEKRSNIGEAEYIAHLVRQLLKNNIKETIGIVAFSQEQQITIENALTNLASIDKEFEELLELAYVRTEEEQFVGLIIKNLENIQGDERDIIIMSVCYGFDARKKMIMNFGPINKKSGEKRLNVLFSRAKKHMAIISSIKHTNITNEYNEGANYFKRFLHYAENVSIGNMTIASTILKGLVFHQSENNNTEYKNIVAQQIKKELEKHHIVADEKIGHSIFKCALAIKASNDDSFYNLGILIDDSAHYNNENILEQYYQRPAILESFGWKTIMIYSKDWLQNPEKVIQQILAKLKQNIIDNNEGEMINVSIKPSLETTIPAPIPIVIHTHDNSNLPQFKRYEFSDASSNKFWEVATDIEKLIIRFGRIGTKGQTQIKTYENVLEADKEMEKAIKEKLGKGYVLK